MLEMRVDNVISNMTPVILKPYGWGTPIYKRDPRTAVVFGFDARFGRDEEYNPNYSAFLFVCITARKEVFWSTSEKWFMPSALDQWTFTSAHESCWKDMPFISEFYFKGCEQSDPGVAPCEVKQQCWFHDITLHEVEIEMIDHYNRKMSSMKTIQHRVY